jgi:nitroreductase
MIKYDFKNNPWQVVERSFPQTRSARQKLSFLLRYAILAPSSHNTQPWKFQVSDNRIGVFANTDRWLKIADADQSELHISVGCAIENLLVAAEHFDYGYKIDYFPEESNPRAIAVITLEPVSKPSSVRNPELFNAIFKRHTNHTAYEPQPISLSHQRRLDECCAEEGISLYLTSDMAMKRKVDELINHAGAIQFANADFREELGYWIGQGVFGAPWLLAKLSQLAVSYLDVGHWAAKKDSDVLMSAPVLGVICSERNDRETQVKVGRVLERIYLTAAALGLSIQPLSQIIEVADVRRELTQLLPGNPAFAQQPFRLGYAEPEREHTPRRPLEDVMM